MLRLFGRYVAKPLDAVVVEDIDTYQRHLVSERKVGFSSFNPAAAPTSRGNDTCYVSAPGRTSSSARILSTRIAARQTRAAPARNGPSGSTPQRVQSRSPANTTPV